VLTSQPDSNKDAISVLLRFAPQKTRSLLLLLLLLYPLPISPQYRALQALTWKCAIGAAAAAAHRRDNKSRERKRTPALKLSLAEDDKLHIGPMDADKKHWSLGFRPPREDTDRWTKRPTAGFNQKFLVPPAPLALFPRPCGNISLCSDGKMRVDDNCLSLSTLAVAPLFQRFWEFIFFCSWARSMIIVLHYLYLSSFFKLQAAAKHSKLQFLLNEAFQSGKRESILLLIKPSFS
jgi:hypothetical protein